MRPEQVMPGCCEDHCEVPTPGWRIGVCPQCGNKGKPVPTLTVKSLVRGHSRVSPGTYFFCRSSRCEVVYFSDVASFEKRDLKVRVGLKETEDPIPLCYCFDYTRSDVCKDLKEKGGTDIPDRIKAEIKAGHCACEVKNPAGSCCLGDITRAIREAEALLAPPSETKAKPKPLDPVPASRV